MLSLQDASSSRCRWQLQPAACSNNSERNGESASSAAMQPSARSVVWHSIVAWCAGIHRLIAVIRTSEAGSGSAGSQAGYSGSRLHHRIRCHGVLAASTSTPNNTTSAIAVPVCTAAIMPRRQCPLPCADCHPAFEQCQALSTQ